MRPTGGVFVDRTFAERAAGGNLAAATRQVWTTAAAAGRISAGLTAAGVRIVDVSRASTQARALDRQAPGLASALYLADAVAAAVLAAATAIAGLAVSARRRRYEYAALAATGERRWALVLGLFVEQLLVLVFSAVCRRRCRSDRGACAGVVDTRVRDRAGEHSVVVRPPARPADHRPGGHGGRARDHRGGHQPAACGRCAGRPAQRDGDMTDGASTEVSVRCTNLVHVYRSADSHVAALRGIDLTVTRGETVALLGPSGAGKSTLLWHFAGLLGPTAGTVEVEGHDLSTLDRAGACVVPAA